MPPEVFDAAVVHAAQAQQWLLLALITAAFLALMALRLGIMAAILGVPAWFWCRVLGWKQGLAFYALTLLIAYRFAVSH
jgi:hypothetical protein